MAIPLICSGVNRRPKDDAVRQALQALNTAETAVTDVTFVLFDESTLEIAKRVATTWTHRAYPDP